MVSNSKGDAIVSKTTTIEVKSKTIKERNHQIYSDSSEQDYSSLCVEAWDKDGKRLSVIKEEDSPKRKEFTVKFGKEIKLRAAIYVYLSIQLEKFVS